ncbi:hypothetical protein [Pseudanabaena sp. FACHB-2040]|uniref:hypothetical protein n=1 Tax=Pseudanabaena sp. FACHB-2040 TaxID=2692859 RepID=UPI00168A22EB|nr:hypothetical protein [Pseudanabaena sp. FACHB-2040]MBD2261123.1 hypothetical protein [Pseudanabaena sp. FACHB-2040]
MNLKTPHLLFAGLVALTAIPSLGNLKSFSGEVARARAEADRIGQDMTELQLAQQEAEQKAAIADERYRTGVVPVVDLATQGHYVTLSKNQPVLDSLTRQPLPAGTVVADANGNTGVLVDDDNDPTTPAVVQKMAFTGNRQLVQDALAQYGGASYGLPTAY